MKWDREIEDVRELKKKGAARFLRSFSHSLLLLSRSLGQAKKFE